MPIGRLEEQVSDWRCQVAIDRNSRVVRNVALSGMASRNGYRYAESALREAARLYDHKPVFLDHGERREGIARSTKDLVGTIINASFDGGRVRGDVRVLETESGRMFLALADGNAPGVGMSHVVLAQRSADGTTVERIHDVLSVDVVVRPATTESFCESTRGEGHASSDESAAASEDSAAGESGHRESPSERLAAPNAAEASSQPLLERLERLIEQLAVCEECRCGRRCGAAGRETSAQDGADRSRDAPSSPGPAAWNPSAAFEALLESSGLPDFAMTAPFRRALALAADDEMRRALIDDRLRLMEQSRRARGRSSERADASPSAERATFVRAVCGR